MLGGLGACPSSLLAESNVLSVRSLFSFTFKYFVFLFRFVRTLTLHSSATSFDEAVIHVRG